MGSVVRDAALWESGARKMAWAARHMPVLNALALASEEPLKGLKVGMALHLEAKTAVLARTLARMGAQVAIAGSNPLSTQDDVAAALAREGVSVYSWHGATAPEYQDFLGRVLGHRPEFLVDDGGDLVQAVLARGQQDEIKGGAEETTTGVRRLRAMHAQGALPFPMVAVNDSPMKQLFDNRYGTGQSTWDAIMRTTNVLIAGKEVAVFGYGFCGRGIAMRARGLGARVTVVEIDPVRASEALLDGHRVARAADVVPSADILVTATGMRDVIGPSLFPKLKNQAILANAGHFDVEIDVASLRANYGAGNIVRPGIEEFRRPDGRVIFLLAEGRLVNLAAGDGHPVEIMDLSFALQALTLVHLSRHPLAPGVHSVPEEVDAQVALAHLQSHQLVLDQLTPEQLAYRDDWREGTR